MIRELEFKAGLVLSSYGIQAEIKAVQNFLNDESIENGLNLWVVSDNLRKGAALNTIQIAEILLEEYLN